MAGVNGRDMAVGMLSMRDVQRAARPLQLSEPDILMQIIELMNVG